MLYWCPFVYRWGGVGCVHKNMMFSWCMFSDNS